MRLVSVELFHARSANLQSRDPLFMAQNKRRAAIKASTSIVCSTQKHSHNIVRMEPHSAKKALLS